MKTLTLYQPWASLVAHGIKTVETRSWSTKYRGWMLIHAGKTFDLEYYRHLRGKIGFEVMDSLTYPTGVIVAKVALLMCEQITPDNKPTEFEQMLGDYTPGRYQWIFGGIEKFEQPIPARGSLGLWEHESYDQST